jgi:aldehyde dehydrogenase (NAD+)
LETLDNGKTIRETRDIDIPLAARHFSYHAGWAQIASAEFPDHQSIGVVGQIIPWNFPFLMLAWKIAPALAAGNTVILKPAEYTSLTALFFAELCQEAGLPAGVVNIVTGAGDTGSHMVNHSGIQKIAFTGSTAVGKNIRRATAGTGKKLTLELGGKSPFIVFDDADLDAAVEGLVDAIWFNQGQVCCAGSRLLVEESIAERLVTKIKSRLKNFKIGSPLDKCMDMGAIVDQSQLTRITDMVEKGRKEGAEIWQAECDIPSEGYFYPPTLVTEVGTDNILMCEEVFGPVLTVMTFRSVSEAISLANNTLYGLSATIYSENINRALECSAAVNAGIVWVNTTNQFDAACGFGGVKESGFGREGGREGMYEYLALKSGPALKSSEVAIAVKATSSKTPTSSGSDISIDRTSFVDRTAKNYVGGKQARPDGGNTMVTYSHDGRAIGRVGEGNRKDIRNAVEAAVKNPSWSKATAFNRAQILYYIAENLSYREDEFVNKLMDHTGVSKEDAQQEFDLSVSRLFTYAAWADKFDGQVHTPPVRNVALAVNEPIGVMGIICPDVRPLLSFVSLIAPALAMGNRVVVIPSEAYPLFATDFYQILETSDLPAGALNIITGARDELSDTLAKHDGVASLWYFGPQEGAVKIEELSADNLKRTFVKSDVNWTLSSNAFNSGQGTEYLRAATCVKNIWLPYGD